MELSGETLLSSDSEAHSSNPRSNKNYFRLFTSNGKMIKLDEREKEHGLIKEGFLRGMGSLANEVEVVGIHKNSCSSILGQARKETFRIYSEAMRTKCGGNANIRYAWFGSSRDEIYNVISHGFSTTTEPKSGNCFGVGVHLYAANVHGVLSASEDENGLRHVLLCKVILGNTEIIQAGSKQFKPTSEDFDSGVDNIIAPTTYIIWAFNMNTHIFPNFLVSFRGSSKMKRLPITSMKPSSRIKFPDLLRVLSKFVQPSRMVLISKYYDDFKKNKITKFVLVRKLRQIAGDTSLRAVMKMYPNNVRTNFVED